VTVRVLTSAQTGQLEFLGSSAGLNGAATISVTGNLGSVQLSFASSTKSSAIVASINQFIDTTGVTATLSSNSKSVKLVSGDFGATQFVSVSSNNITALSTQNLSGVATTSSFGANANLTVNGVTATSDGLNVKIVSPNLDASFTLSRAFNQASLSKTFGVTGGGATFSLGAQVDAANLASIGIDTVNTASLGSTVNTNAAGVSSVATLSDLGSGKIAAVNTGDTSLAQRIVTQAITDVANLRGRLGAFQTNVLGSTINSLNVALENVASSNSAIRDTDFATETANLTRAQILSQAATSVLSQANQSPQAVLKLLQ